MTSSDLSVISNNGKSNILVTWKWPTIAIKYWSTELSSTHEVPKTYYMIDQSIWGGGVTWSLNSSFLFFRLETSLEVTKIIGAPSRCGAFDISLFDIWRYKSLSVVFSPKLVILHFSLLFLTIFLKNLAIIVQHKVSNGSKTKCQRVCLISIYNQIIMASFLRKTTKKRGQKPKISNFGEKRRLNSYNVSALSRNIKSPISGRGTYDFRYL